MPPSRTFFLPVAHWLRELDGKLLLALIARERGYRPIIGYVKAVNNRCPVYPSGIYLAHSARRRGKLFDRMEQYGHKSVVLDEESLVRPTNDIFLMKHERDALDKISLLLTWGDDDAEFWTQTNRFESKRIVATGNPRNDMLRSELRAFHQPEMDVIRSRFGEYVLLNTNFFTVNHPENDTFSLASWVTEQHIGDQKERLLNHRRRLLERYLASVPKIAQAIAPVRLIIRPHPSESHRPWLDVTAASPNASVVFEGSVVPWMMGARALIHNNCTSAVECAAIGTTVLTYRPVQSDVFDNPLPNRLGIECFSEDELITSLRNVLSNGARGLTEAQSRLLNHHVSGISGKLSCERIVDAFDQLSCAEGFRPDPSRLEMLKRHASQFWHEKSKQLVAAASGGNKREEAKLRQKFPEVSTRYLDERIRRFQGSLDRFHDLKSRRIANSLFAIE